MTIIIDILKRNVYKLFRKFQNVVLKKKMEKIEFGMLKIETYLVELKLHKNLNILKRLISEIVHVNASNKKMEIYL